MKKHGITLVFLTAMFFALANPAAAIELNNPSKTGTPCDAGCCVLILNLNKGSEHTASFKLG